MKRIIGVCLIVCLFLSCFSVYARENDYEGTKYEVPSKVLNAFNIISFNEDGNVDVGSIISRAEFTVMVAKALAMDVKGHNNDYVYSDVEIGSQIHNAVIVAKNLGIISGYSDGTFRPNDTLTVSQASSMLVKMLGYNAIAESKGGYPVGYLQVAKDVGITDEISDLTGSLKRADAILMLYNAMNADMMKQVNFGVYEKYQVQKDVNVFSEYHDVYRIKGIITDNGRTSLTGDTKIMKHQVKINDEIFESNNINLTDYLGYTVEIYYYDKEDKEIVYGYVPDNKNEVTKVDAKDLVVTDNPISDGYFTYKNSDDRNEYVYISKEFDLIYNGRAYPQFKPSDMFVNSGVLVFVDNNTDGYADVVFVEEFKHIIVSGSDKGTGKIYSFDNSVFTIDDMAEYEFTTTNGESLDISDLAPDQTISIYESFDKKFVRGIVSDKKAIGVIEEIIYSQPYEIKINGIYYKVSTLYKDFENTALNIGDFITAYIDHKNEIAFINDSQANQADEYDYGYLINAAAEKGLSNKAVFRIFTKSGEFKNLTGAANITFNGSMHNSSNKKYTSKSILESPLLSSGGKVNPQLIRYKLNSAGEIVGIETAVLNTSPLGFDNERFSLDYKATAALYRDIPKMFNSRYVVNNDTVLFNIPTAVNGEINEDACMILSLSQFEGNYYYPVELYDSNASRICKALVTSHFSAEEYSRWGLLVEKITTAINSEGTPVTKVYGYMSGKKSSYEFSDTAVSSGNIKAGDLLKVTLNVKNEIVKYEHLFDSENEIFPSEMSGNPGGILVEVYGRVLSKEKGSMTVVVKDNEVYPFVFSTYTKVYYVDKTNKNNIKVGLATSDDIIQSGKNYKDININNVVGSKVYINRRYDNAYDILIVKD